MYRVPRAWLSYCSLGLVASGLLLASQEFTGSRMPGCLKLALCSSNWCPLACLHACLISPGHSQLTHLTSILKITSTHCLTQDTRCTKEAHAWPGTFTIVSPSFCPQFPPITSTESPLPPVLIRGANLRTALLGSEQEVPPAPETLSMVLTEPCS